MSHLNFIFLIALLFLTNCSSLRKEYKSNSGQNLDYIVDQCKSKATLKATNERERLGMHVDRTYENGPGSNVTYSAEIYTNCMNKHWPNDY